MIKIDVEGAEDRVVAGASATLASPHPMTVLLDLHPKRVDTLAVCEQLRGFGFSFDRDILGTTREAVADRCG